jgi:hypothetical protein
MSEAEKLAEMLRTLNKGLERQDGGEQWGNPNVNVFATGGRGTGINSGFAKITGNIPVNKQLSIHPWLGGSAAFGNVGGNRIEDYKPQAGVNFGYVY